MTNTYLVVQKNHSRMSTRISGLKIPRLTFKIEQTIKTNGELLLSTWACYTAWRKQFRIQFNISGIKIPFVQIRLIQMVNREGKVLPITWYRHYRPPKKMAISKLKSLYGLTQGKAEKIVENRENSECEICRKIKKILYMDHNHKNGKFRGLICHGCNLLLGRIENPIENHPLFAKLKKYIER